MGLCFDDGGIDPLSETLARSHKDKIAEMMDGLCVRNPFKDFQVVSNGGRGFKCLPRLQHFSHESQESEAV